MAIDAWTADYDDAWVSPQKTFYPTNIPVGHSQLRHLISSPSPNVIYFVEKRKVYCLDTTTNTRILVVDLPFEARCTASGYGWFCAGGESDGYFAAIRIPDVHTTEDLDGHLPDCPERLTVLDQLEAFYHTLPPRIRVEQLGADIVNSVSLHLLRGPPGSDEDEVVALLTNNDRTVRIYSLTKEVEIRSEKFDFPMNHATISPDGTLLMIVGDKETAYFYQKVDMSQMLDDGELMRGSLHASWVPLREIRLHKPAELDNSSYFTTTWSPTSRFCATASENGAIILIDADALADEERDPIVTIMFSSRPESFMGGVRAMCFAPYPWDLLMWNEDHGRMCVADLRNGLHMRQVIELDRQATGVTPIEFFDASLVPADRISDTWTVRSRAQRTSDVTRDIERLNSAAQRYRRSQESAALAAEINQQALTEEEQQILDGLRTSRQIVEETRVGASTGQVTPRSINYNSSGRTQRHYAHGSAVLGSIRNYLQEQGWGPSNGTIGSESPAVNIPAHPQYPAVVGLSTSSTAADPWRIIEAAMQNTGPNTSATRERSSNHEENTTDVGDDVALAPFNNPNENPSPRTQPNLPNLRQMRDSLRLDSEAAYRDYRQRVAELDAANSWRSRTTQLSTTDAALRGRLAELEAEIEATERQRITNESLILAAETETAAVRRRLNASIDAANATVATLAAERDVSDRRRRLLDMAAVSAEVNTERRRRIREVGLRVSLSSGTRDSALTTRGEAVLAREMRENREQTRSGTSASPSVEALREARELSLQALRGFRGRGDETARPSRVRRAAVTVGGAGNDRLKTTGIAWGDSTVYVGVQEGIFELKLNFEQRKFWPAVEKR